LKPTLLNVTAANPTKLRIAPNPATGGVSGISILTEGLYTVAPTVAIAPVATASVGAVSLGTVTVAGIGAGIKEQTGTKINEYDTLTLKTINGYITVTNTGKLAVMRLWSCT